MKKIIWILLIGFCAFNGNFSQDLTDAMDILDRIDQNMVYKTAYAESEMIITIKNRVITKKLISYSQGNEKSFIEFLSPARDRGTKILKIEDIVKIYYPSAERVLREEYTAEVAGEETIDDRLCYLVVLVSKFPKQTYFTRKIWVDKERFLGLKEELYSKAGKLLKVMIVDEIKTYRNRFYPTRIILEDKLRKNSRTEMIITRIDFDVQIPPETFTERRLMKK
jgi:outer membrane lipoprotein-sorting protein